MKNAQVGSLPDVYKRQAHGGSQAHLLPDAASDGPVRFAVAVSYLHGKGISSRTADLTGDDAGFPVQLHAGGQLDVYKRQAWSR